MQKASTILRLMIFGALALLWSCSPQKAPEAPSTEWRIPQNDYAELFEAVQLGEVFADSKTFVDCTPLESPEKIMAAYAQQKDQEDFDLTNFVATYFRPPYAYATGFIADTTRTVQQHIESLWPILTREPDSGRKGSLIPLPNSYVVPGGRFGEVYYWDSYFTMLGLQVSESAGDRIEPMIDNFAYLIDTVGFIPNGNRTYFLGRSQPPFFSMMVRLLVEKEGPETWLRYLPALEKEYHFWMHGHAGLSAEQPAFRRVVRLPDGGLLNRYWDQNPAPRPESYKEDVHLAEASQRPKEALYRDLRAACESGWDFSSRWLRDPQDLGTIHTTEIIPVDLNCLLLQLERALSMAYEVAGKPEQAEQYLAAADARANLLLQLCWNAEAGYFSDYDWVAGKRTDRPSLAMAFPLWAQIASSEQAEDVARFLEQNFLQAGGLVTTLERNGQQWDAPNGWAPLQWIAVDGLISYEHDDLAHTIVARWANLNRNVYEETGKLVEKYNVMDDELEGGGGEYPLQDGFGWTNGVLLRMLNEFPEQTTPQD